MSRSDLLEIEYRTYELPSDFPIKLIHGEDWRISDIPSGVLHFHNCVEIGICESDGGWLDFLDGKRPFRKGDITFISGDIPHTTWSHPGTASKWSYLFLDAEELLKPFFPLSMLPNAELFRELLYGNSYILPGAEYPRIASSACAMVRELIEEKLNYEIAVRSLFLTLATELMRLKAEDPYKNSNRTTPIAPALAYINQNYMKSFPIDRLAECCRMSSSHFRKVFKRLMGMSPLEHLHHIRILKACSLLRMTESSILDISISVGFTSLSSFNRQFKSQMGVTPSQWRRHGLRNRKTSVLKYSGWLTPPKN